MFARLSATCRMRIPLRSVQYSLRTAPGCFYGGSVSDESYDRVADLSHTNPACRSGEVVSYPAQPWTATTHSLLRHLEDVGYAASQRVVGDGIDASGNEVLTWMDGTVHATGVWPNPEESLLIVGGLLRDLHRSTTTFSPPSDAVWMPWTLRSTESGSVVSHGNVAPWHVVFDSERPVGFIGWEYSGPVDPIEEVAATGWFCAQLVDEDVASRAGLRCRRTRAMAQGLLGWL